MICISIKFTMIRSLGNGPESYPESQIVIQISIPIEDVLALLKKNFTLGVLFEKWVGPDDRNSKNHIIQVSLIYFLSSSFSKLKA